MMHPFITVLLLLLALIPREVQSASELAAQNSKPSSSVSRLLAGLQDTRVTYPESRATFVHFPPEAKALLEKEMVNIHSPLVLDIVTTVTDWKAPLWDLLKGLVHRFRNQNQIMYVRAHYFVGNGLSPPGMEEPCRMEWIDQDTGIPSERAVGSEDCFRRCTNGGRYCAPVDDNLPTDIPPRLLVEETLRRLCIDDLYHASDLKHWEYLEAFEALKCHEQVNMANCSKTALSGVSHTDWSAVQNCVQLAGGLQEDVMNVRLQEQLDRQQGSYTLQKLPLLHIAGTPFAGPWEVSEMLAAVCYSYRTLYDTTPVACDFCTPCQDVRKCLWYLECDGTPFSVDALQHHSAFTPADSSKPETTTTPPPTSPLIHTGAPQSTTTETSTTGSVGSPAAPDTTTPPMPQPTATPPASETTITTTNPLAPLQSSTNDGDATQESAHTTGFFLGGILAGLIFGVAPAFCFARLEKNKRREILAALAAREQPGSYRDDDLATSYNAGRFAPEEMQNMQDITLEDPNSPTKNEEEAPIHGRRDGIKGVSFKIV